jgi:hypothetical protein
MWWDMPVIPATQEAGVGRLMPDKAKIMRPSFKNKLGKQLKSKLRQGGRGP